MLATIHCTTLHHTVSQCTRLQYLARSLAPRDTLGNNTLVTIYCNTLQRTATRCNPLQPAATHCNPLQPTATPLQPTATYSSTWREFESLEIHLDSALVIFLLCHYLPQLCVFKCGAVCCSVVQCDAVWCSMMQCGAA